jgi:hypothetical protein
MKYTIFFLFTYTFKQVLQVKVQSKMDLESHLHDTYEEEKQQRYLELVGHTNDYLYLSFHEWSPKLLRCVETQGIEKEKWNCPSHGEVSLNFVTSEFITTSHKPQCIPFGSVCAICMEPITNNKNAYLTECYHHFHKECITAHYNATFVHKKFDCPLCRHQLKRCLWLESRYALEPWRLDRTCNHKKVKKSVNVSFEFQRELFNEDIILCRGCDCTPGCFNFVGRNPDCQACQLWKDVNHKCVSNHSTANTKKHRTCCLLTGLSFLIRYRQSLIMNN